MDKTIFLKVKRLQEDIDASSGVLPRKDVEKQLPVDAFDQLVTALLRKHISLLITWSKKQQNKVTQI